MKPLAKLYEWVLLLPALLPLFFVEGMMYPLMTPKTLAFRALGVVACALFAYLVLAGRHFYWSRLRYWEAWVPAALLAVAYLASASGADFYRSFWSTFERGDGLLTLTAAIGYFYLLLLHADASWLPRLMKVVAWVGSLSAVYMVLQWLAVLFDLDLPLIVTPNGRVGGTMGNAAFMAAYFGMALFATLAAARDYQQVARLLLYAGAALECLAIILTATRGTMLALFAALVGALAYGLWKGRGKTRAYAGAGLALLLLLAGTFFLARGTLQKAAFEPVRRMASISLIDATVASRLFLWGNLWSEALKKPVLGYGAEHIAVPFDRVYDPTAVVEEWFDRSHNAYLDYFVQFGIFGVLLYSALIGLLFRLGWRLSAHGDRYGQYLLLLAAVYAMQNFFVFDTAVTLWLFLALIAVGLAYASPGEKALPAVQRTKPVMGMVIGAVLLTLLIPVALQPLRANLLAFEAYLYQIVDIPRANAATEKGMALDTYADLEFGYNAYFMYTTEQVHRLTGEDLRRAYENARSVLTTDFNRYPYDARTAVYLAQVLASAPADSPPDKVMLSEVLARAIEGSPKRAQSWYILANLSIAEANTHPVGSAARKAGYAAAKDILERYSILAPGLAEPYFIRAQLEYASGDSAAASREAAEGKARYKGSLEAARRAASYYESVLDLPNAAFFLREILRFAPGDTDAQDDLSQIEAYERANR